MSQIDGPRYFALALRLTAYNGVMAAIAYAESKREGGDYDQRGTPRGKVDKVPEAVAIGAASGWVEHVKGE